MSRRPGPPSTLQRSELVFQADGTAYASFLWDDLAGPPSPKRNSAASGISLPSALSPARVSRWGAEFGEEPCFVGPHGSGVVFFGNCHLRCLFCHNFEATQEGDGVDCSPEELLRIFLDLAERGCSNLHLISPTPFLAQLREILPEFRARRPSVPVILNLSGYESTGVLRTFLGLVDIYLPDFKFGPTDDSRALAGVPDYFVVARKAIREMADQVGFLQVDEDGLARRGLLVRHLVMPGMRGSSRDILRTLYEDLGPDLPLHIMGSYHPAYRSFEVKGLEKSLSRAEYDAAVAFAREIGFRYFLK